jgi:hypothetical protein
MMTKFACCTWSSGWMPQNYDIYRVTSDRAYARRANLAQWLRDKGYTPEDVKL